MRQDERGSALLVSMLILLAMAVLGATFLSVSLTDRKIAANEADASKAFAASEAGIEDARAALATTNVNTLLTAGGHLFTGSTVGAGTYVVDVLNNCCGNLPASTIVPVDAGGQFSDTDRYLVLNATGTVRKASRRIQTVVRMPISYFNYGLRCNTGATFQGAADEDAYNSTLGSYNAATNRTTDASAFCNGNVTMQSSSMIYGDCTVGDNSCNPPTHSLSYTALAPTQTFPTMACPAGGYPASVPAGTGGGSVSYNSGTGALSVNGGATLTLSVPPTSYYFSSLTVSSSTLTFNNPTSQHVDIYVSGTLTVSGGGIANPYSPPMLGLWACGAGTNNWDITGTSNAKFSVYAPNRQVTLSGNSPLFGAVVAANFVNSGHLHYDHALASSGIPSVVPRTWREIFP
jgi:Tfp pilus assembly protein PilX